MPQPTALFWSYQLESPSFRHRLRPVAEELERRGWRCVLWELPRKGAGYLRRITARRDEIAAADLMVLAKINLAFGEARLLRRTARRLTLDLDDAIYLRQRKTLGAPPEVSCIRLARFGRTADACDHVTAGNERLAAMAARWNRRVTVIPTTVEVAPEPPAAVEGRDGRTLVWIGLDRNLVYLQLVRPALARLARRFPDLRVRIVCDRFPDWDDVAVERVAWSQEGEAEALATADVGLMPLTDDAWTRGKCSFKLLQYMAAGLPTVASPVGTNVGVVADGRTGFLARTADDWYTVLRRLLEDPERARAMGRAGQARALAGWERTAWARRHADVYEAVAGVESTDPPRIEADR